MACSFGFAKAPFKPGKLHLSDATRHYHLCINSKLRSPLDRTHDSECGMRVPVKAAHKRPEIDIGCKHLFHALRVVLPIEPSDNVFQKY